MGLDMHLMGRKFIWRNWDNPEAGPNEDGYPVQSMELELGYWRKHPNLHGYIVREFAGGEDDCNEVVLSEQDLQRTIEAVERGQLPHTTGFFFGDSAYWSTPERVEETTKMLHGALRWLQGTEAGRDAREVLYRASW